jgi:hypothetical protein
MEEAPTQEIPPYILVAMLFAILIIYYYGHIFYHNIRNFGKGIFRGKQKIWNFLYSTLTILNRV